MKRALETQRLMTENMLMKEEFSSQLGLPRTGKSEKDIRSGPADTEGCAEQDNCVDFR